MAHRPGQFDAPPTPRDAFAPKLEGRRILVIDSDMSVRFRLVVAMREFGAVCSCEATVPDAVHDEVHQCQACHAVLVDVDELTPPQAGDAVKLLRDAGFTGACLAMSSEHLDTEMLKSAGFEAVLGKPVNSDEMLHAIQEVLPPPTTSELQARLAATSDAVVTSDLLWCPTTAFMLNRFVESLPGRLDELKSAVAAHDLNNLTRLTHRLKASASSHGYRPVTEAAGEVEHLLQHQLDHIGQTQRELDELVEAVDRLSELCGRVTHLPSCEETEHDLPPRA